jgi:hypothetical protein
MSARAIIDEDERADGSEPEGFDFAARIDALRCHSTDSLRRMVADARVEQQRWHLEELAALRVLDDRDALGPVKDGTISARTAADNLVAARAYEQLPKLAAATYDGAVTWDQARSLVQLATPETDAEWAQRGPNWQPMDLERKVRQARVVTSDEVAARREARVVTTWRDDHRQGWGGRYWLPDIDGAFVDKLLEHKAEQMRPAKGMKWDSLAHRKADAFVEIFRAYADGSGERTGRFKFEIVNIHQPDGTTQPEVAGIPLAQEQLVALTPSAKVRECVTDENGLPVTVQKPRKALPADVERYIRQRDLHCRTPGCTNPAHEIHHLNPVSVFGDTTDVRKLAGVCTPDHYQLAPNGKYWLVGDAERPDGLQLMHRDDLPPDHPAKRPRDGPSP